MGDFNTEENDENISNFMESYNLKNIVKTPTCFKVTVNVCDTKFGFRSLKAELLTESR